VLQQAARGGHRLVVAELLKRKCDVTVRNQVRRFGRVAPLEGCSSLCRAVLLRPVCASARQAPALHRQRVAPSVHLRTICACARCFQDAGARAA
jgi:hypothetical protein